MSLEIRINPADMPAREIARAIAFLIAYVSPADLGPIQRIVGRGVAAAFGPTLNRGELVNAMRSAGTDTLAGIDAADLADKVFLAHAGTMGDDNPESGTPTPGEAFPQSAIAPEVRAALTPSTTPPGPSPEAAFGGNAPAVATFSPLAASASVNAPIAPGPVGTPAAPAPVPGASAPPVPSSGVELDAKGLPWDARIHAKSGSGPGGVKNADGSWRAKRGLNDGELVARVEAELRAVLAAPGPTAAGNGSTPPLPLPLPLPSAAPAPLVPAPVPPPAAPVAPAGGGTPPPMGYVELVQLCASSMTAGKLLGNEVEAACVEFGVPSLPLLATRPDLVPSVASRINQILSMRP